MTPNFTDERIAKIIARSGYCSRRDAEKLISAQRVKIDDVIITNLATKVNSNNKITIDDKNLPKIEETLLWRFYKPKNIITSRKDPQNRQTIYDILPKKYNNLIYIGRLDFSSEGLLLLTNNGEFARKAELPSTGLAREYLVRAFGLLNEKKLMKLTQGITIDNINYAACEINIISKSDNNCRLYIKLFEGKNREVRKLLDHVGLRVDKLKRISYGPIKLNDLKIGAIEAVEKRNFENLL